jgi:hypothetical protein
MGSKMKLKKIWKYVLVGLLLTITPLQAAPNNANFPVITTLYDHIYNYPFVDIAIKLGVGIKATAGNEGNATSNNSNTITFGGAGSTVTIAGINVANINAHQNNFGNYSYPIVAGVAIDDINDVNAPSWFSLKETTINVGDINIGLIGTNNVSVAGLFYINSNLQDATLKISNINITNTDNDATGLMFSEGEIRGKITVGNINVKSNSSSAIGFDAWAVSSGADIQLGNINVTGKSATGISVENIEGDLTNPAKLTVGDIKVTCTGTGTDSAVGIELGWDIDEGNIGDYGSLKTGNITVNSNGSAIGIVLNSIAAPNAGESANSKFDVGEIRVNGGSDATGIYVGGNPFNSPRSTFTISRDIIVTTTSSTATAVGISASSADLNINTNFGDVQITGTNAKGEGQSISGVDTLTISGRNKHTNKGKAFTVNFINEIRWETDAEYVEGSIFKMTGTMSVATGKTVVVNGEIIINNNYIIGNKVDNNSDGTLVLKNLKANDVTVNSGMLALDGNGVYEISNLFIDPNATVAIYGNINPDSNQTLFTLISSAVGDKVISLSSLTEYKSEDGVYVASNRERANLADGFLLPASIHNRLTAWDATLGHLISGRHVRQNFSDKSIKYMGQSPYEPYEYENAWVNYVNRFTNYRSSYSSRGIKNGDWKIWTNGIQTGLDVCKTGEAQLGLLFGYEGTVAKLRADRVNADDVYFGAYAARVLKNGADYRLIYNYGMQEYKMRRFDPGLGLNQYVHDLSSDGNTHEVNFEYGKRINVNMFSFRPVIGLDVIYNDWRGALENGNIATAIAYANTDFIQAFVRTGTDFKYIENGLEINAGVYYSYDMNGKKVKSKVYARNESDLGYDKNITSTLYGSNLGRSIITFNCGGSYKLNLITSLFGGYIGDMVLDRSGNGLQSTGHVGLKCTW